MGGGYFLLLLFNSYYWLISETKVGAFCGLVVTYMSSLRNGFTFGFIFMLFGVLISRGFMSKTNIWKIWILFVIACITLIAEVTLIRGRETLDDTSVFISFLVLIPCSFRLTIFYVPQIHTNITYMLRKLSSGYFFLHSAVLVVLKVIVKFAGFDNSASSVIIVKYCVVILFATIVTVVIWKSKSKVALVARKFI